MQNVRRRGERGIHMGKTWGLCVFVCVCVCACVCVCVCGPECLRGNLHSYGGDFAFLCACVRVGWCVGGVLSALVGISIHMGKTLRFCVCVWACVRVCVCVCVCVSVCECVSVCVGECECVCGRV